MGLPPDPGATSDTPDTQMHKWGKLKMTDERWGCYADNLAIYNVAETYKLPLMHPEKCEASEDTTSAFVKVVRLGVGFLNADPLALPNNTLDIPMLGSIALHDGKMAGLKSVRRTGPNSMVADVRGLNITFDVGTGHLAINYTTTLSFLFISRDVLISVQVECMRITLQIKETKDTMLALSSLSIKSMQGLDVRLKAVKVADPLFNTFLKTATTVFKGLVEKVAEIALRQVVKDLIDEINVML
ncbi:uncharacterized protein LOC144098032 [Amblyomma americanum]